MEQVEFEEQTGGYVPRPRNYAITTKFFIKLGLAKDQKSANGVMVIISILSLLAASAIFAYYVLGYNPFVKKVTPDYSNLPLDVQKMLQPAQK